MTKQREPYDDTTRQLSTLFDRTATPPCDMAIQRLERFAADVPRQSRRRSWLRWSALASGFAVSLAAAVFLLSSFSKDRRLPAYDVEALNALSADEQAPSSLWDFGEDTSEFGYGFEAFYTPFEEESYELASSY